MNIKNNLAICGMIGAGKSSLLSDLRAKCEHDTVFIDEPLNNFTSFTSNGVDVNPLSMFYQDMKSNSLAFQLHVLDSYMKLMKSVQHDVSISRPSNIIWDRTVLESVVFTDTLVKQGQMSEFSHMYWDKEFNACVQEYNDIIPKKLVYLDVSVDFCLTNIAKRNRKAETDTNNQLNDYLLLLKESYCSFLDNHRMKHGADSVLNIKETNREKRILILQELCHCF